MWLWYNTQLIRDKELILNTNNRAFQYGDGIFETIVIIDGQIQHASYHADRIKSSIKILKLNFILSFEEVEKRITFLLSKNNLKNARAKMIIWRQSGGYYVPDQNDSEYLILVNPLSEVNLNPQHLEISKDIRIPRGISKNCKTLNALPYVLAGLELKEWNDADDLLLLNFDGFITECISSNIFWTKNGDYFTPSLETNCVAGVKRKYLIDQLKMNNIKISEVEADPKEIFNADSVFKTNVTGIFPVKSIGKNSYKEMGNLPFPLEK